MELSGAKKYNIPVENLSYNYINECSKKVELEHIVRILRSGEEGYYPDLLRCAEGRLLNIAPQSSLLRTQSALKLKGDVPEQTWSELSDSLHEWEMEIKAAEVNMKTFTKSTTCVPIRKQSVLKKENLENKGKEESSEKISRDDYRKWDTFDVDEALLKMDIDEERKTEEKLLRKSELEKLEKDRCNLKRTVTDEGLSEEMKKVHSEKAREKGNEYFKSGDLQFALNYYNESFNLYPNSMACNNRAMTYIKLGRFTDAIEDCNYVLEREPMNIKALMRRANAYRNLPRDDDWQKALKDLETVISVEPNNKTAKTDYQHVRKKLKLSDNTCKVRLKIDEAPREPLPILFYGASTSAFRCEPNSAAHRWLAGPTPVLGRVPCRCNRGHDRQNPLCQPCGERDLRELLAKSQVPPLAKRPIAQTNARKNPSNSEESVQSVELATSAVPIKITNKSQLPTQISTERADRIKSEPNDQASTFEPVQNERLSSPINASLEIKGESLKINDEKNTDKTWSKETLANEMLQSDKIKKESSKSTNVKQITNSDVSQQNQKPHSRIKKANNAKPSVLVETNGVSEKGDKERLLAMQAKDRGNKCFQSGDYSLAVAYYTTSIKLFPDFTTYNRRAAAYMNLKKYDEAIADCCSVLQRDPLNTEAFLRRATAYNTSPDEHSQRLALDDFKNIAYLGPTTKRMQKGVNKILEDLTPKGINDTSDIKDKNTCLPLKSNNLSQGDTSGSPILNNVAKDACSSNTCCNLKDSNGRILNDSNRKVTTRTRSKKQRSGRKLKSASNASNPNVLPASDSTSNLIDSVKSMNIVVKPEATRTSCSVDCFPPSCTGFQFYSRWETCRKTDPSFDERLSILQMVSPEGLVSVIGEKLDGDMLSELIHCINIISKSNTEKASAFLDVLPKLPRFQAVKLFLDSEDDKRLKEVISNIKKSGSDPTESTIAAIL